VTDWLIAFLVTVAIELPIVGACAPRGLRRRAWLDCCLANVATHPLAWLLVMSRTLSWTATECAVVLAEALIYGVVTALPWRRAALAALFANGVTAALSFAF